MKTSKRQQENKIRNQLNKCFSMDVTQNIDRVKQLKSVYNDIGKMISDEERFIEQERKAMKNKKRILRSSKKEAQLDLMPVYPKTNISERIKNDVKKERGKAFSYAEKLNLARRINELPCEKLIHVVQILRNREKHIQIQDPDNIDLDLLKLKNSTIRKLKTYVYQCLINNIATPVIH